MDDRAADETKRTNFKGRPDMKNPTTIPRGADLTDADLRQIIDDFIEVRNWAALKMRMGVPAMKEELFQALRVRLGRRPAVSHDEAGNEGLK